MNTRNGLKSKKSSKLKHTEPFEKKFSYNSPHRGNMSSGLRPKCHPNISIHYQMQKKHQHHLQQTAKNQYYHQYCGLNNINTSNKEKYPSNFNVRSQEVSCEGTNKSSAGHLTLTANSHNREKPQQKMKDQFHGLNSCSNVFPNDQSHYQYEGSELHHRSRDQMLNSQVFLDNSRQIHLHEHTDGKIREKRHTHAHIQIKKNCQISHGFEYLKMKDKENKENKGKSHFNRQPINLGDFKNKNRLPKSDNKKKISLLNNHQPRQKSSRKNLLKKEKPTKEQKPQKLRTTLISEDNECSLHCWENILGEKTSSVEESKISIPHLNAYEYLGDTETSSIIHDRKKNHISSLKASQVGFLYEDDPKSNDVKNFQKSSIVIPGKKSGLHRLNDNPKPTAKNSPRKSPEEEIREFEKRIKQIDTNFEHDCLSFMEKRDLELTNSKNLNCYLANQQHLDWKKRALIINWMVDVLSEIGGRRETLANAVNIFDMHLSQTLHIQKDEFQCVAASCMLIAAKLEDKTLSAFYLSETTSNKYSPQQITETEWRILVSLGFRVNMPTLNSWANRLATQWDQYLEEESRKGGTDSQGLIARNMEQIKFKNTEENSYYNYRRLCQYIDFALMDLYTLRYQPRMISLAFIYLVLVMKLDLHQKAEVINNFPHSSQFLLESTEFNDFFEVFLRSSFQLQINDLLPMIQYCATFVILPLRYDLPEAVKDNEDEIHYEEFCSLQTRNEATFSYLSKRCRDII